MFKWSQSDKDAYNDYMKKKQKEGGVFNLLNPLKGIARSVLGENTADSLINQYTKEGWTGAEEQTANWNAQEAEKNREWQADMANTTYQRTVADMQAAGLNPALAYGNAVNPTPQGSSSSTSNAAGGGMSLMLDFLAKMKGLEIESAKTQSEIKLNEASAGKLTKETSWIDTLNTMSCGWTEASIDKLHSDKQLTDEQIENAKVAREQMLVNIDYLLAETEKTEAETVTEYKRAELVAAQALLQKAESWQIYQLTNSMKGMYDSQAYLNGREAYNFTLNNKVLEKQIRDGYWDSVIESMEETVESQRLNNYWNDYSAHPKGKGFGAGVAHAMRVLGPAAGAVVAAGAGAAIGGAGKAVIPSAKAVKGFHQ